MNQEWKTPHDKLLITTIKENTSDFTHTGWQNIKHLKIPEKQMRSS